VQQKGRSRHAVPAWVFGHRSEAKQQHGEAGSGVPIFAIYDMIHLESSPQRDHFESLDEALAEVLRRAQLPWDQYPNIAPCREWATCGRECVIREYRTGHQPWKLVRVVPVVSLSAAGVTWPMASTPPNGHPEPRSPDFGAVLRWFHQATFPTQVDATAPAAGRAHLANDAPVVGEGVRIGGGTYLIEQTGRLLDGGEEEGHRAGGQGRRAR
jgi:hypothetical protein